MTATQGASLRKISGKAASFLRVRWLGDKTNKLTCESNAKAQRSSVMDLEENCMQPIATVLNGSQDLAEVFNFSKKRRK